MTIRTVVWGENIHERENDIVRGIYPDGMHATIAAALNTDPEIEATTATLQEPEHGLPVDRLAETDVLVWWGHKAHGEVSDEIVERVAKRVWEGMGLLVLHSGHFAKPFKRLMGTPCALKWREAGERAGWRAVLGALKGHGDDQILSMGVIVFVAFSFWMIIAHAIFAVFMADSGMGRDPLAALITPYIIGFAGFYDRWPWLSFTPLSYTLAFGPLLWLYAATLCGRPPSRFRPSCPMASRRRSSGCASPSLMPSWMKARRG